MEGIYNQNKKSASKQAIAVLITDFYLSICHIFASITIIDDSCKLIKFQNVITNWIQEKKARGDLYLGRL